ncbi:MAG: hypothetical protein RIC06_16560 [Cyclobacteriaceae bacterium]
MERIRLMKPKFLYVAADGPRHLNQEDEENCKKVRDIVQSTIDWPCELNTLYRDENLGCGKAVSEAISWFFNDVEYGIIIEDDCLPSISFFRYCEESLEKYQGHSNVMHIGGLNWIESNTENLNESIYFSRYPSIWGWATWRRAWKKYDFKITNLDSYSNLKSIIHVSKNNLELDYHLKTFNSVRDGEVDTWDYQWVYSLFVNRGVCISPAVNLVSNIGFGDKGTHTKEIDDQLANREARELTMMLFPDEIKVDETLDELVSRVKFQKPKKSSDQVNSILKRKLSLAKSMFKNDDFSLSIAKVKALLRSRSGDKVHLIISCFPKSASTFLTKTISETLGLEYVFFTPSFHRVEQEIHEIELLKYLNTDTVTHQHFKANSNNIKILKEYGMKPVVLVRNLYDAIVSFRDHCLKETTNAWSMAYINAPQYKALSMEKQFDFIIDLVVPWYLNFYLSWKNAYKDFRIQPLIINYNEVISKPEEVIETILLYAYGIRKKVVISVPGEDTRFNVGETGRGMKILSKPQIKRIESLMEYYPEEDFSDITK